MRHSGERLISDGGGSIGKSKPDRKLAKEYMGANETNETRFAYRRRVHPFRSPIHGRNSPAISSMIASPR